MDTVKVGIISSPNFTQHVVNLHYIVKLYKAFGTQDKLSKNIEENKQNKKGNLIEIVDKREEYIDVRSGQSFSVNRNIKSNYETEVVFATVYTEGVKIKDIKVDNESVFDYSYNRDSNENDRIEQVIDKLPQKIKELKNIAISKPFNLYNKKEIQIDAINDESNTGRISYIVISEDGIYDYETTTHIKKIYSSSILTKSFVDNTLTDDCFLRTLSFDHKSDSSFNDNAKKSTSSGSGDIFFALDKKSLYSSFLTNFTTVFKNLKITENCISDKENRFSISDLYFSNSINANPGEYNKIVDKVDNSRAFDLSLKKENKMLVSTTNLIQKNPCFLSLLNLPLFSFLPKSVNSLSLRFFAPFISSSINPINFLRFSSNTTSSSIRCSNRDFSPLSTSGIFTSRSSIFIPNDSIGINCLNSFANNEENTCKKEQNVIEIVDKREEYINSYPNELLTLKRNIKSNYETEVVFAAIHTSGVKIKDIKVDNESVFDYSYNRKESQNDRLENIIDKLPEKIKELDDITLSKPIKLDFEKTISIDGVNNDLDKNRISYIVLSEDGIYDYETTTHLNISFLFNGHSNSSERIRYILDFIKNTSKSDTNQK